MPRIVTHRSASPDIGTVLTCCPPTSSVGLGHEAARVGHQPGLADAPLVREYTSGHLDHCFKLKGQVELGLHREDRIHQ